MAFRDRIGNLSLRAWVIGIIAVAMMCYLVIAPMVDSFLEQFKDRPTIVAVEDLTAFEVLRIRSSKLIVFAIFSYLGACVGSFLNVVASAGPRGEAIALRSSACPQCQTPIRRIDNLPIISYLMLQGRCRACQVHIPIRYLAVELAVMGVFASLFLYELITGAANVPNFRHYHYTGIVWMILYTKWPVIGIYFFHVMMFAFALMFALMEVDRLKCPGLMAAVIIGTFAILPIIVPTLLPVAFDHHLPISISSTLASPVSRTITAVVGGLVGGLISIAANKIQPGTGVTLSWVLIGVALGWQATVTIAVFCGLAGLIAGLIFKRFRSGATLINWISPTMILFAVAMLHHPAWRLLGRLW